MVQIIYELEKSWPDEGSLWVETPSVAGEIKVSPVSAQRKANGYLTCDVAMAMRPGDPVLIWGPRPVWRMSVYLQLPDLGPSVTLGSIDVDAQTREVIPLPPEEIATMQDKAHAIASRVTPEATPAI